MVIDKPALYCRLPQKQGFDLSGSLQKTFPPLPLSTLNNFKVRFSEIVSTLRVCFSVEEIRQGFETAIEITAVEETEN
jgi:hypothetical protein